MDLHSLALEINALLLQSLSVLLCPSKFVLIGQGKHVVISQDYRPGEWLRFWRETRRRQLEWNDVACCWGRLWIFQVSFVFHCFSCSSFLWTATVCQLTELIKYCLFSTEIIPVWTHSENFIHKCKIFLKISQKLALAAFKFQNMWKNTLKFDLHVQLEIKFNVPN